MNLQEQNAVGNEKLYDLEQVNYMCHGNNDAVRKMTHIFISQIPPAVTKIGLALTTGDFETIHKTAHRIKPVLRYYGISRVENEVRALEQLSTCEVDHEEIRMKIDRLEEVVNLVVSSFKKEILND